jgi:hypothetical protein
MCRHISLSNAVASGDHPGAFMWNILSRLHLVFKVRGILFVAECCCLFLVE